MSLRGVFFVKISHLIYFVYRFSMVTDLWIWEEGIAEGHVIVVDMDLAQLGHVGRMSLMAVKKYMYYLQVRILTIVLKQLNPESTVLYIILRKPCRFV